VGRHQSPEHPHTLDDARIQLVVDELTALALADGDLTGKGRVVPPPPHGLPTHAHLGCDVGTAATLLGHSPEVMLRVYRKVTMGDMRDALRRAGRGRLPQGQVASFPGA
jgi:integrase